MINAITDSRLVSSRCSRCADVRFPPRPTCVRCASPTSPLDITAGHVVSAVAVADGVIVRVRSDAGPVVVLPADGVLGDYSAGTPVAIDVIDNTATARPRGLRAT